MEAKSSIWLAASLLLFKLVMPFIPYVRRCIRSSFLLKNHEANLTEAKEQQEETVAAAAAAAAAKAANFRLLGNEEDEEEGVGEIVELPDHVIESLLLPLLPVRSLLRFRIVSKQWNYTISSPAFSTQHMINISHVVYLDLSEERRFFFPSEYVQLQAAPIPDAARLSSSHPPSLVEKRLPYSKRLLASFQNGLKSWVLCYILSCNGLVCFLKTPYYWIQSIHDVSIQILNLATNKRRLVGELPDDLLDIMRGWMVLVSTTMLGFGFDPTINDFKIVFMFRSTTRGPICWITRVMSLKTNTWRKVDHCSSNYHDLSRVNLGYRTSKIVAVAGGVFWIVTIDDHKDHAILKFSLAEERFELISFPNIKSKKTTVNSTLSCHGGSLYLLTQTIYGVGQIDLWMLPMGSASNVWNKVTTFIPPPACRSYSPIPPSSSICNPLGIDCNGHVIIVVDQVLYAYLLKERKFVELDSSSNCRYSHLVQMETLACP